MLTVAKDWPTAEDTKVHCVHIVFCGFLLVQNSKITTYFCYISLYLHVFNFNPVQTIIRKRTASDFETFVRILSWSTLYVRIS